MSQAMGDLLQEEPMVEPSFVDVKSPLTATVSSHRVRRDQNSDSSNSSDSEDDNDSESDDTPKWKRIKVQPKASNLVSSSCKQSTPSAAPTSRNDGSRPKMPMDKFNVWSNVLLEQELVTDLNSFGVKRLVNNERGCEGYDFTLKYEQEMHAPASQQNSHEIHRRLGCKRSAKERLGTLPILKKDKRAFHVTEDDEDDTVIDAITTILREQKRDLIAGAVRVLGKKKALELLQMTEDIEEAGGMMTVDGSRRRTAGGVYLLLLRQDHSISLVEKDEIFAEEKKLQTQSKKQIIKARRRKAAKAKHEASAALTPLPTLAELILQKGVTQQEQAALPLDEDTHTMDVGSDSDRESGELDTDDSD